MYNIKHIKYLICGLNILCSMDAPSSSSCAPRQYTTKYTANKIKSHMKDPNFLYKAMTNRLSEFEQVNFDLQTLLLVFAAGISRSKEMQLMARYGFSRLSKKFKANRDLLLAAARLNGGVLEDALYDQLEMFAAVDRQQYVNERQGELVEDQEQPIFLSHKEPEDVVLQILATFCGLNLAELKVSREQLTVYLIHNIKRALAERFVKEIKIVVYGCFSNGSTYITLKQRGTFSEFDWLEKILQEISILNVLSPDCLKAHALADVDPALMEEVRAKDPRMAFHLRHAPPEKMNDIPMLLRLLKRKYAANSCFLRSTEGQPIWGQLEFIVGAIEICPMLVCHANFDALLTENPLILPCLCEKCQQEIVTYLPDKYRANQPLVEYCSQNNITLPPTATPMPIIKSRYHTPK